MENDRNNKLHSLLNAQFEQPIITSKQGGSSKLHSSISQSSNSALSSLASMFKNSKNQPNSLLNNIPSHFLPPLLASLPFNIRNSDLFNDEKASLLLSNTLAAAAVASAKSSLSSKSLNIETKSSHQSGPPPAHQSSSSRNALPLGTLDLTSKFKNAATMEKATISTGRSGHPYPAHKSMNKNLMSDNKTDVLDLSSVTSKHDPKSAMSNLLSQSLQKSIDLKNSAFLSAHSNSLTNVSSSGKKKQGKIGSRIDALALNLQAKKMMEEVKQVDSVTTLANKAQSFSTPRLPKAYNEKEFLAALSNLGDKRSNNMLFDEYSKQAMQSLKSKNVSSTSSATVSPLMKKPVDSSSKASSQFNLLDSLKLLTGKSGKDSTNLLQKNLKMMLEEHPELLSPNNSLTSLLSSQLMTQGSHLTSLNSPSIPPSNVNTYIFDK